MQTLCPVTACHCLLYNAVEGFQCCEIFALHRVMMDAEFDSCLLRVCTLGSDHRDEGRQRSSQGHHYHDLYRYDDFCAHESEYHTKVVVVEACPAGQTCECEIEKRILVWRCSSCHSLQNHRRWDAVDFRCFCFFGLCLGKPFCPTLDRDGPVLPKQNLFLYFTLLIECL